MSVNLQSESERGARARQWLDDSMTKEAFETVRAGIYQRWSESPIEDREGQYTLRLMLKLLEDLHGNISQVAMTGVMADVQIKAEQTLKERAKNFLNKYGVRA